MALKSGKNVRNVDVLDFSNTPVYMFHLGIKINYKYESIIALTRLGYNQMFGRLASKLLYIFRKNTHDWCNANKFTNKNGLGHSQVCPCQFEVILIKF